MGMDVYGQAPTSETGAYFRRNVWGWHPLWELCCDLVPHLTEAVQLGHTNDGDGLGAEGAELLAKELQARIDSGLVAAYVARRNNALDSMPDEQCQWCNGTGVRKDEVGIAQGMDAKGWCNACDGKGSIRPWATSYDVNENDVVEWVAFLRDCGGFKIF